MRLSQQQGSRRVWTLGAASALCWAAACGTRDAGEPTAKPGQPADPGAGAVALAEGASAVSAGAGSGSAEVTRRRAAMAEVYHVQRCVLTGAVLGQPGRFAAAGASNAAAFEALFLTEAQQAPGWAAEVLADSYQRGCGAGPQAAEGP